MNEQLVLETLKKVYLKQLFIAAALILLAYLLNYFFETSFSLIIYGKTVSVVISSLAGIFGIALPIFYRSYFVYSLKKKKQVSNELFMSFEKNILNIALSAPYFLIFSLLMNLPETTHILITLFSLYAVYFYFPSAKKIRFELKIFRIKLND